MNKIFFMKILNVDVFKLVVFIIHINDLKFAFAQLHHLILSDNEYFFTSKENSMVTVAFRH